MEATATTAASTAATQDALAMLKQDHDKVEQMFMQCEQESSASGSADRSQLVQAICSELKTHTQLEEMVFYPALREAGVESGMLDEAEEEHAEAKRLVEQLESASGDAVDEPLRTLMEAVRHHVREEEDEMFPAAREARIDLADLGRRLAECKQQLQ